jgi:hypothetical protein
MFIRSISFEPQEDPPQQQNHGDKTVSKSSSSFSKKMRARSFSLTGLIPAEHGEIITLATLPDDVLLSIFQNYLTWEDVVSLSKTCTSLEAFCNDNTIWRALTRKEFPQFYQKKLSEKVTFNATASDWLSLQHDSSISKRTSATIVNLPLPAGAVNWKKEFKERMRIRRNWKHKNYNVTTLEIHRGKLPLCRIRILLISFLKKVESLVCNLVNITSLLALLIIVCELLN